MRSRVSVALRRYVHQRMRERLPEMNRVADGERLLFESRGNTGLSLFLLFQCHRTRDEFTVEMAWSPSGQFPFKLLGRFPRDVPECRIKADLPKDGEFRFRIGKLWTKEDVWWTLGRRLTLDELEHQILSDVDLSESIETAIARVPVEVDDAIGKVIEFAIPYFNSLTK